MSAAVDHEQAAADVPEGFFFALRADETGIRELRFRKDGERLFGVLLFALEQINTTFDEPFPAVGDFCRYLGSVADQIEAVHAAREQQAANDTVDESAEPEAPSQGDEPSEPEFTPPEPEAT